MCRIDTTAQRKIGRAASWRLVLSILAVVNPFVSAAPRQTAIGWPEYPPSNVIDSKTLTCAGRSLDIVRQSETRPDGKSQTRVTIRLDGIVLAGSGRDKIVKSLEQELRWMAVMGNCIAESRDAPEIFVISVLYQRHERDAAAPIGFRVICGSQVVRVDPRAPSSLVGFGDERPAKAFHAVEDKTDNTLCF